MTLAEADEAADAADAIPLTDSLSCPYRLPAVPPTIVPNRTFWLYRYFSS